MNLRTKVICGLLAIVTGAIAAQAQPGINNNYPAMWNMVWEASTLKKTYSATTALAVPASSATDVCSLSGSATRVVRVRRIIFTSTPTTAVSEPIAILKRSTAYTAGAGAALTKVPYDSQYGASTVGMAEVWTGNPTVGTIVGALAEVSFHFGVSTTAPSIPAVFTFGQLGSAAVLRGVAQNVAINLNGTTFTGTFSCTFEWTEE